MKDEKPGGHGERCGAVGLIDAALWDLAAKAAGRAAMEPSGATPRRAARRRQDRDLCERRPLSRIQRFESSLRRRSPRDRPGPSPFQDQDRRRSTGVDDLKRIEAVLGVLESGMSLAVDGNGTFDRDKTIHYLEALAPYPLAWIEEPVHPLDFDLHRDIARDVRAAARDRREPVFLRRRSQSAALRGLRKDRDLLQFDISLSYGIVEYLRILDESRRARLAARAAARRMPDICWR